MEHPTIFFENFATAWLAELSFLPNLETVQMYLGKKSDDLHSDWFGNKPRAMLFAQSA